MFPDFDFPIRAKSLSFFDNKWPFEIKYVSNNVVNRRPRKSRFILILVEEVEHLVLISVLEVSTFYLRYNTNVEASHGQAGCLFLHVYVFIVSMMTMYTFTGEGILSTTRVFHC